jgi:hypothetical protein
MAATITVRLVGAESDNRDVRFSEFITQLDAIKTALKETETFITGAERHVLDYKIVNLTHQSPSELELEPILPPGFNPLYADRILKGFTTELRRIRQQSKLIGRPDMGRLSAYREIGPKKKSHLAEVDIGLRHVTVQREARIDKQFKENLKHILGPDERMYGSISGRLEYVNMHSVRKFRLYPTIGPKRVNATFSEDIREQVRAGVDRYVTVFGELKYKTWDQFPYEVNAKKIDVHEADKDLPTLYDLKGIAPNLTGGLSSVEWVRNMRDEEW